MAMRSNPLIAVLAPVAVGFGFVLVLNGLTRARHLPGSRGGGGLGAAFRLVESKWSLTERDRTTSGSGTSRASDAVI